MQLYVKLPNTPLGAFSFVNLITFILPVMLQTMDVKKLYVFTCVSYAEARNSYRLDVRPSVRHWYCIKTAEHIVMLSSPHDSPFILVLCI